MRAYLRLTPKLSLGGALLLAAGCQGFFVQPDSSRPVQVRIENDTSELLEVRINVASLGQEQASDSSSGPRAASVDESSDAGDLSPASVDDAAPESSETPAAPETTSNGPVEEPAYVTIGLRPPVEEPSAADAGAKSPRQESAGRSWHGHLAREHMGWKPMPRIPPRAGKSSGRHLQTQETVSEDVVRVSARDFSDGFVSCGDLVTLTATLVGDSGSTVSLSGAGTGTLGFDEGSVGPTGERMLLSAVHFECGEVIVIRVTAGGASAATGTVEVFASADTLPPPTFDEAPPTPTTIDDEEDDQIEIRINNQTGSFAQLNVVTGAAAALGDSTDSSESDGGIDVRVAPGFLSTGVLDCTSRLVLTGSIVLPGVGVGDSDSLNQVILLGEGTGAPGFDENSVGVEGQERLLLLGSHYECGDVIEVEFTSDGNAGTDNETLGLATVSVAE